MYNEVLIEKAKISIDAPALTSSGLRARPS